MESGPIPIDSVGFVPITVRFGTTGTVVFGARGHISDSACRHFLLYSLTLRHCLEKYYSNSLPGRANYIKTHALSINKSERSCFPDKSDYVSTEASFVRFLRLW